MIEFTKDVVEDGVRERWFVLENDGAVIPTVIWTPVDAEGRRPKVLFGHGGMQHKKAPNIVTLATSLVRMHGYAAVSIDAPGHGHRVSPEQAAALRERLLGTDQSERTDRGNTDKPYLANFLQGVADWRVVLDEIEQLPDVGTGPTGWWGVSMGTSIGLPFVATEPRITCAVLGLASSVARPGHADYLGWAKSYDRPLLFLAQRDDAGHPLDNVIELFDLFGSAEKTMHLNPGPHVGIPAFERDAAERFFHRHLGDAR